ncbi:sigma-70 family RNA polymerase sigma factor [Actinomarinicola tropica]|uniref:Sigma-70 family RNA polymerase sigma factor n=1 Tax=Actinomarinicola tropica TaxID=2789776 RepID=A0A5Q2RNN3_9ACTN|nr:sigma-70 family RNA polymerase sigma factor [Actinomarinicola tropica]QGG96562.1 sigma-70 family RNA polymerase sigma factor [Actinomarinicola tropica]
MRVLVVVEARAAYGEDDFERFCRDAHPGLVAALAHHCGDRFLAEELAQEALIRAGDRWTKVRQLDSPVGWAFRVGANMAASSFRRRGAERRAVERMRARPLPTEHRDPDAGDAVAVRGALRALPERQRRVVLLRYVLDLSAEQAGAVLGISAGAVRMQAHRALAALQDRLRDDDIAEEVTDGC